MFAYIILFTWNVTKIYSCFEKYTTSQMSLYIDNTMFRWHDNALYDSHDISLIDKLLNKRLLIVEHKLTLGL